MNDKKVYAVIKIEVNQSGTGTDTYTEQQFQNLVRDISNYLGNREMANRDLIGKVVEAKVVTK